MPFEPGTAAAWHCLLSLTPECQRGREGGRESEGEAGKGRGEPTRTSPLSFQIRTHFSGQPRFSTHGNAHTGTHTHTPMHTGDRGRCGVHLCVKSIAWGVKGGSAGREDTFPVQSSEADDSPPRDVTEQGGVSPHTHLSLFHASHSSPFKPSDLPLTHTLHQPFLYQQGHGGRAGDKGDKSYERFCGGVSCHHAQCRLPGVR